MPRTKADPAHGRYFRAVERFPRVRQSTLATFDSCGLSSKFESDYRQGWSTHPQARGQIFHRTAAECLRTMSLLQEPRIPVGDALAHLHDVMRQDGIDRVCPYCESSKIRRGVKDGLRTCGACGRRFPTELANVPMNEVRQLYMTVKKWAHDNEWPIEALMDVEYRLNAPVEYPNPKGGTVRRVVTGQLDAVFTDMGYQDRAIVYDWKDTWALPAPTEISFEGYFQQRIYGWLVMVNYPAIQSVTLREFYPRYSEPREATLWREDLDEIQQEFSTLVERFDRAVHENVWVPTPGKHCDWCMRPSACRIPPIARGVGRIRTEAEAVALAHQYGVASASAKQAKGALQTWTNIHGPVPIVDAKGRRQLGYREAPRKVKPSREEMEEAIRMNGGTAQGLDLDKLFKEYKATRFEQHPIPREVTTDDDAALLASLEGALAAAKAEHDDRDEAA